MLLDTVLVLLLTRQYICIQCRLRTHRSLWVLLPQDSTGYQIHKCKVDQTGLAPKTNQTAC